METKIGSDILRVETAYILILMVCRPKLEPLVDYLMSIGKSIEKRKGANAEDVVGLARRLKRMLVELNEYDRARSLSKAFQLKEAL